MLECPESTQFQNEVMDKVDENICKSSKKAPGEGSTLEINSFKSPKTWKKSLTNFFRNQLRSTKSNEGDPRQSGSQDKYDDKEVNPEQKWQSLGKIFRRQSFVEHWNKSPSPQGESSSQSKRLAVRKVLSSYFGKNPKKSSTVENEK